MIDRFKIEEMWGDGTKEWEMTREKGERDALERPMLRTGARNRRLISWRARDKNRWWLPYLPAYLTSKAPALLRSTLAAPRVPSHGSNGRAAPSSAARPACFSMCMAIDPPWIHDASHKNHARGDRSEAQGMHKPRNWQARPAQSMMEGHGAATPTQSKTP
ncbi:hypothetical protein FDECE_16389 [Fusarium decemcellulare]|nr:hypothetical protein FDECE_16389 [Fusarium decemcellulare]